MLHRSGQICQVGFNVSSTLQEHSISVLTKCRARLWIQVVPRKIIFRPGQTSPGRFLLYLFIIYHNKLFTLTAKRIFAIRFATCSAESAQRHSAPPCIGQYTAQKFICLVCICRSRVDLSAWKSALFRKISLSERSEFEIFLNAFSRFSDT